MQSSNFLDVDISQVKGVLIDIDDTLYSYESPHKQALLHCYQEFEAQFSSKSFESYEKFAQVYRQKRTEVTLRLSPQGVCRSRLFAFQSMFEDLEIVTAYEAAFLFEQLYWNEFLKHMQVSEEAYHFLKSCKQNNIKVCAVTDMQTNYQVQKLKTLKIETLIDFLVTSEEVGVEKPDKKMFLAALSKLKLASHEVIMLGDSLEKDIQGAQNLNIKAFKVDLKNSDHSNFI